MIKLHGPLYQGMLFGHGGSVDAISVRHHETVPSASLGNRGRARRELLRNQTDDKIVERGHQHRPIAQFSISSSALWPCRWRNCPRNLQLQGMGPPHSLRQRQLNGWPSKENASRRHLVAPSVPAQRVEVLVILFLPKAERHCACKFRPAVKVALIHAHRPINTTPVAFLPWSPQRSTSSCPSFGPQHHPLPVAPQAAQGGRCSATSTPWWPSSTRTRTRPAAAVTQCLTCGTSRTWTSGSASYPMRVSTLMSDALPWTPARPVHAIRLLAPRRPAGLA